jgi:hypothetical protein
MSIRRCLLLALALASFGCSSDPEKGLPTSPSILERQSTNTDGPSPQATPNRAGLAAESAVPMELVPRDAQRVSDWSEELEAEIEDTFDAGAAIEVGIEDTGDAPDAAAPEFDVPGKPTTVTVDVVDMEIRMKWGPAPAGKAGAPTRYLVYCNCTGKIEALAPTARAKTWKVTKPGTYTLFVLAGNTKGSGPTVNKTAVVSSTAGTYKGVAVSGVGSFRRVFSGGGSCTWKVTFTVTPTIVMKSGPAGTLRLAGGFKAPSPGGPCLPAAGSFAITRPLAFTATNFSSTHTIDVADMKFLGALVKGVITGKVTITYRYGSGQIVIPLTLKKT